MSGMRISCAALAGALVLGASGVRAGESPGGEAPAESRTIQYAPGARRRERLVAPSVASSHASGALPTQGAPA